VVSVPRMRDGPKMLTVPENQTFRDALLWFGLASHHSMLERSILSGVPFNSLIPCPPFVIQPPFRFRKQVEGVGVGEKGAAGARRLPLQDERRAGVFGQREVLAKVGNVWPCCWPTSSAIRLLSSPV
jgi:hypothetical protein